MKRLLCALLLAFCPAASAAEILAGPFPALVVRVVDGDTFEARVRIWLGQDVTTLVRIRDIDAPELHGNCPGEPAAALAARTHLAEVLADGQVLLGRVGHDKYGRRIDATVRLPSGRDVGQEMLESRHARPMKRSRVKWC